MLTDAQKAVRRGGLGSSDIGAVAGLSPYATALDAHCDATGLDRDAWIAATLDEQRATLAGGVTA